MSAFRTAFARWLRDRLEAAKTMPEDLARKLGVSLTTVREWEEGTSDVSAHDLCRVAHAVGRSPRVVIDECWGASVGVDSRW